MKSARLPLIVLALLFVCFVIELAVDATRLPGMVATHFDLAGKANSYMTRSMHLKTIGAFGLLVPLAELALFYFIGSFKSDFVNIPHRHYWLAPERRDETLKFIFRQGAWLTCLTLAFFGMIEQSIVVANQSHPAFLSPPVIFGPAGGFLVCIGIWMVIFLRRFARVPAA
jgi:uncharacterized membrane protein